MNNSYDCIRRANDMEFRLLKWRKNSFVCLNRELIS